MAPTNGRGRRAPLWVIWLVGLLGAALILLIQLLPLRDRVEASLTTRSGEALEASGYDGVEVRFSGRDGVVSGGGIAAGDVTGVEAVVQDVVGVRAVRVEDVGSAASRGETTDEATDEAGDEARDEATDEGGDEARDEPTDEPTDEAGDEPTDAPSPEPVDLAAVLAGLPSITFEQGSAVVTPESGPVLDRVAAAVRDSGPGPVVEVQAHTDSGGRAAYNQALSDARAAAVRDALVARGVDATRLAVRGFGESTPLVPEVTDADRERNRRVEFAVLPPA
ncbi:MAG: OmpA family protein [Kineosporiaceae bacterium]